MIILFIVDMMCALSHLISKGFFSKYQLLIVPIPTGTSLLELERIDEAIGASSYSSSLIPVERLSGQNRLALTYQHAQLQLDGGGGAAPLA
jgi:hypothetical protein